MSFLYELWDDFLSLLFPRLCPGCGNHLVRNESFICTDCYVLIPRTSYHTQEDNPVARLFWGRSNITRAAAFSYYNRGSRIRKLIHCLKYKGMKEVGTELGKIYGSILKSSDFICDIDIIIPVPLHPDKQKKRGFNQSEIIADGISINTGIPVDTQTLCRKELNPTQTKRSRYERWANVEGIFSLENPDVVIGKHILLVDDVITTGSTVESCANELLKIEGVRVSVVALAYAVM